MVGIGLTACAVWAGDHNPPSGLNGRILSALPAESDGFSLSPPSFPLDSPSAERRFRRCAVYECGYREDELHIRPAGNSSFDYPAQSQPASGTLPVYGVRYSPPSACAVTPPAACAVTPPGAATASCGAAACGAVEPGLMEQASGMTVYARVDYYYWRESIDKYRLLDESGPMVTLGLLTERDNRRLRAEIFGGQVEYDGETMGGDPLKIDTDYLGCRLQYDFLWPFQHDPNSAFVLGLGTRLWNRNLRDGTSQSGLDVIGYDETWWMLYPTLGLETRRPIGVNSHWFASTSLGVTGLTYERIDAFDLTLYPKMGPMVQIETGIQTPRLYLSVFFEVMQWYASNASGPDLLYQPDTVRLTAGLTGGVHF